MQSIDRLREHASIYAMEHSKRVLREIADAIEAEVAERYVALPLDADGVPIHVGDVMGKGDGYSYGVIQLRLVERGWAVMLCDHSTLVAPSSLRHYHAPTVEDVLREFADLWHEAKRGPETVDFDALVAEWSPKLRLAGDGE